MHLPKISIITPSYNQASFIERTIQSIREQDYPNVEHIVIDGGSTDGTIDILKKYDADIIWKSEDDDGQMDAINKGLRLSTGEIVAYINSDDFYEKETFKKVGEVFSQDPQVMWLCGKCRIIKATGEEFFKLITGFKNFWLKRYGYKKLLTINFISQPAVFWRKSVTEEIGYLDSSLDFAADYDYWLRIGQKYEPAIIDEYLSNFRIHANAKGTVSYSEQFKEGLNVAKRHSTSKLLIFIHRLAYWSIVTSYNIIK